MTWFLIGLALILTGGPASALRQLQRATADRLYLTLVVSGCAAAALDAARVLWTRLSAALTVHGAMPGGDWVLGIDALSAVFLIATLGVGAMCAISGTRDLARESSGDRDPRRPAWLARSAYGVLLASIALVLTARSIVVFLSAWEVMSISSYVSIVAHDERADVRRAGLIFLVAMHTATLALFAMFATWQVGAADWSFAALAAASPSLGAGASVAVLLLALLGFGLKAGLVPLHVWLPPAHSAAPSHISALMSGIVIKTGIYGLLRVLLLLGGAPAWWGWLVLAIGATSGVLGVLWALAQHDIKRLLAYHSVENIGIILMGVGVGALGVAYGSETVALLGFAGALLHTVNHSLFKSVLFLGAGAVYRATGIRNMEELGGLARRMPLTWLAFVVGAAAIIGVPPLNGFVSEWLVYRGLFAAGQTGALLRLALLGIPVLALIGALALACFAKVAGVVFLGTPRSVRARDATDDRGAAHVPTLALACACVALGVVPPLGIALVAGAARALSGTGDAVPLDAVTAGAWAVTLLALATIAVIGVLWLARRALGRDGVRREATWGCGYDLATPRMQYTASSFAAPLLTVFGRLSGVHEERSPAMLRTHPLDLVLDGVALPMWEALHRAALRLRGIQQGRGGLHLYLVYVLAALVVLLGYLALGSRL